MSYFVRHRGLHGVEIRPLRRGEKVAFGRNQLTLNDHNEPIQLIGPRMKEVPILRVPKIEFGGIDVLDKE